MIYEAEIGRMTGLPTAAPIARFALTHEVMLDDITNFGLRETRECTQHMVPLVDTANRVVLAAIDGVEVSSWEEVAEWMLGSYNAAVADMHTEPLKRSGAIVSYLLSLDKAPPRERTWGSKISAAFDYKNDKKRQKLQRASQENVSGLVREGADEGTRATAAYFDVVAQLAAAAHYGDVGSAMKYCAGLVSSSAPFVIEMSGVGKNMDKVVNANAALDRAAFEDPQRGYRGLRFDASKFMIASTPAGPRSTEYVTFTDITRDAILAEYAQRPASMQDPAELFGCPAHKAAGITKLYRSLAEIGFRNGLFEETITRTMEMAA